MKADLPVIQKNIGIGGHRFADYVRFDDAMLLHHVLWSDQEHSLEFVASLLGQHVKLKHLSKSDPLLYNWGDVLETIHIVKALKQQLRLDPRLEHVYERKRRLLPLIIERESLGLRVNQGRVERAIPEYQSKLSECARLATAYSGYPLNLASSGKTGQLARYLNEVEGYTLDSVSKDAVSELRRALLPFSADDEQRGMSVDYILQRTGEGAHPLLELRALAAHDGQILNHFLAGLDGIERVHPTINLHTQASGRHSTTNPPLATLPHDLVDLILPEIGCIEWGYDWAQIELRIIAAEAGDEPLLKTLGVTIEHACRNIYETLWATEAGRYAHCRKVLGLPEANEGVSVSSQDAEVVQQLVQELKGGVDSALQGRLVRLPSCQAEWQEDFRTSSRSAGWSWGDRASHQWQQGRQQASELRKDDSRPALLAALAYWITLGGAPPTWTGQGELNAPEMPKEHDAHTLNACDIFGLRYPPDLVDPHRTCGPGDALFDWQQDTRWKGKGDLRRRFAKVFVYRLLYGAKPETCADIPGVVVLGLNMRGLVRASENWLNRHPAIRAYQRTLAHQAATTGQVYSFMGRRRTLQETGDEAARQAMNHPMQGGCMDVYETIMFELDNKFYPTLRFRWGAHDSQLWDMTLKEYEADRLGGWPLLRQAASLVQQPRLVAGRETRVPATFRVMYDDGRTEPWVA